MSHSDRDAKQATSYHRVVVWKKTYKLKLWRCGKVKEAPRVFSESTVVEMTTVMCWYISPLDIILYV